jgi:hypothetical protein
MCVHVLCSSVLPDDSLVWVDPTGAHVLVYVDPSLASDAGSLTAAGAAVVNDALGHVPGAPSLQTAISCR